MKGEWEPLLKERTPSQQRTKDWLAPKCFCREVSLYYFGEGRSVKGEWKGVFILKELF